MDTPERTLAFALEKYPDRVEVAPIDKLVIDAARQNDKRSAYVTLAVPDAVVKGLRGKSEERDLVLIVRIPHDILGRAESRIVLPGEVR